MTLITMPGAEELVQSGGSFVNKPGWAHLQVQSIEVPAKNRDGQIIQGAACRLNCTVLNHTEPDQIDRSISYLVRTPNPGMKDGGKFVTVIIVRLAQALNIMPNAQPGQQVEIDWSNAVNRQFAAKLSSREWSNSEGVTKTSIDVDAAKIWHCLANDLPGDCPIARNKLIAGMEAPAAMHSASPEPAKTPQNFNALM